jgi:hypothetical protein
VVTNVVSTSQINVFWNGAPASENVTSYNLRIDNSHVIRGITYLSFPVTGLAPGTTHTFEVQAVNSSGAESNWSASKSATTRTASNSPPESTEKSDTTVSSDSSIPLPAKAAETRVIFIGYDTTTKGDWINHYGRQGSVLLGDAPHLPKWAQMSVTGEGFHTWTPATGDPRALVKTGNNNERIAAALFSPTRFEMNFNFTDGQTHRFALYSLDWEGNNRSQTFEIVDALTGTVLDTRTINNFNNGVYVVWHVKGEFTVRVKNSGDARLNSVVSGVFIDAP